MLYTYSFVLFILYRDCCFFDYGTYVIIKETYKAGNNHLKQCHKKCTCKLKKMIWERYGRCFY